LIGKPLSIKRTEEPPSTLVTGEDTSRSIPSVRSRGEANQYHSGLRIAEPRQRFSPIRFIGKPADFLIGHFFAPGNKPWTGATLDDFSL
jgi:hypothetical protein